MEYTMFSFENFCLTGLWVCGFFFVVGGLLWLREDYIMSEEMRRDRETARHTTVY